MQNLEIKCHYPGHRFAELVALKRLKATYAGKLIQTDICFNTQQGRLKFRYNQHPSPGQIGGPISRFEIISYQRADHHLPRPSLYAILPVADGRGTLEFLSLALGVKVRVHKIRKVYLKDNLRIHLDTVRGLGRFLEFELIVSRSRPLQLCKERMKRLMALFKVSSGNLVRFSYSDMLLQSKGRQQKSLDEV